MKSKASFFSISPALVKENLRRFWALPLIAFLAYFLSGVFPILMSYNNINNMYYYIETFLTNQHPFFLLVHVLLPVTASVIIFRYLQNSGSATCMHSMPFTRAQLYNSNILSGLILITLPILAIEIIMQILAKPTYSYSMYTDYEKATVLAENASDIFTRMNVLEWFWQSLIILVTIYIISVFAGMVSGTSIMHLCLAVGFNFLAPALYLTFLSYCNEYLFGFTASGTHNQILLGLTPITEVFLSNGIFSLHLQLFYGFMILLFFTVSYFLYQKRSLEKSGDPMVFKFMIPTISYLIAYFGMTLMGAYFTQLGSYNEYYLSTEIYFYAGLISGAVIAFILGRMAVLKSPRIFNLSLLKNFGIYAIIATVFVLSITLDLTGFENRLPNAKNIKSATCIDFDIMYDSERYAASLYKPLDEKAETNYSFYYKEPDNIAALIQLHKDMIDRKDDESRYSPSYLLDFDYKMNNPFGMQRMYSIYYDDAVKNKSLKILYESEEFKNYFSLYNLNFKNISSIYLDNIYFYDENSDYSYTINNNQEIQELLAVMEKDFRKKTFEEYMDLTHSYCDIYLNYTSSDRLGLAVRESLRIPVSMTDKNTIAFLDAHGYSRILECTPDMVEKIVFSKYTSEADKNVPEKKAAATAENFTASEKQITITDKKQIEEILQTYHKTEVDYEEYYYGTIIFNKTGNMTNTYSDNIYYDSDTAPSFISEAFQ